MRNLISSFKQNCTERQKNYVRCFLLTIAFYCAVNTRSTDHKAETLILPLMREIYYIKIALDLLFQRLRRELTVNLEGSAVLHVLHAKRRIEQLQLLIICKLLGDNSRLLDTCCYIPELYSTIIQIQLVYTMKCSYIIP